MQSLTRFNIRFTLSWRMGLFAFFIILLFIRLGFWQLQRASEKKHMLETHQAYVAHKPIKWRSNNSLPKQYQQIQVKGHFLSLTLLLDNQHYQHQFGYHVISPLQMVDGSVILVDRGWLAGDVTRQRLPFVEIPTIPSIVRGSAYYPSENWRLGPLVEKKKANTMVIELIDIKLISQILHKPIYPFIIRLGALEANGYVRDWAIVAMPPERHYAYALQWFAMALVTFIIFIVLIIKKKS